MNLSLSTYRILRAARIVVSVSVLATLTCALVCFAGRMPVVAGWLEKLQLGQAVVAFSMVIFVGWMAITLVWGRVYCSTVCPLGTLQDVAARIPRMRPLAHYGDFRRRYRYARPATMLRYGILVAVLLCLMAGYMVVPSILDPYSAFERICLRLLGPLAAWIGSVAGLGTVESSLISASVGATVTAGIILAVITVTAARSGRTICNTVCPVGTALGCVSRFSLYQMDIDTDLCINCGKCEDVCKASCIDLNDHIVDGSRCVVCFDCVTVCPNDAIRFTRNRKQLATPLMQRFSELGMDRQPEASLDFTGENISTDETISDPSSRNS